MNKLNRYYISQNISIDNALSMNQILHQIVNEIKGIVEFINNLELRANEYTDEQIRLLNERLQAQLETLEDTLKTYTNDKIDEYNAEIINPQLIEIRNTIDTINRTINERIDREVGIINRHVNSVESTLNKKIDDTKEYLEELIKKGNQLVYSSISGRKIPIQDTLFEMGNALKQILSYNWNSIDEFKNLEVVPSGYTDISNSDYGYKDNSSGFLWNFQIVNDNLTFSWYASGDATIKVNNTSIGTQQATFSIPLNLFNQSVNYIEVVSLNAYGTFTFEILNKNIPITHNITFNSIKLAMQELNVNWNTLSFTGVNTFYELNETEKMFDTTGVKSDYFANDKYKVIHNNFESDFFKSNIN